MAESIKVCYIRQSRKLILINVRLIKIIITYLVFITIYANVIYFNAYANN